MYRRRRKKQNNKAPYLFLLAAALVISFTFIDLKLKASKNKDGTETNPPVAHTESKPVEPPQEEAKPDAPATNSKAVFAYDIQREKVLLQSNSEQPMETASLAKLFVIDYALSVLDLNTVVTVGSEILLVQPDSSMAGIREGEIKVSELVKGMLVPSGNDAAYALAAAVGRHLSGDDELSAEEAVTAFTNSLAEYLQTNGFDQTRIPDPSGYSSECVSTVKDLFRVSLRLLNSRALREIMGSSELEGIAEDGSSYLWTTTHEMMQGASAHYNPGVKGIKTGSTDSAYNLITGYESDGREYLIIVLGSDTSDIRYQDTAAIIEWLN